MLLQYVIFLLQVVITQKPDLKTRLLQSAKKTADLKKRAVSISWATPGKIGSLIFAMCTLLFLNTYIYMYMSIMVMVSTYKLHAFHILLLLVLIYINTVQVN